MAVSHKGAISFGLVHIPVSLHRATQEIGISFNQMHKDCKARIRYKKTCPDCNIEEVEPKDIVKGYEYEKDRYVIMTDDDFEKIKTEKDKRIQILHFTDNQIDPVFFETAYYAVPDAGGERAYALLRTAMLHENKSAVAKTVIGTKETLLLIRASEENLNVYTMRYLTEIKSVPMPYSKTDINEAELSMAKMLIDSMVKPFQPEIYKDEYQERLRAAIEQKINGKEIVTAPSEDKGVVIDLMDALKKSLDNRQNINKTTIEPVKAEKPKAKKKKETAKELSS